MTNWTCYTEEAFRQRYDLDDSEAERLFSKFGPYKVNLDLLMKGENGKSHGRSEQQKTWQANRHWEFSVTR